MPKIVVYTSRVPKRKGQKDFMKHENTGKWIGKKTIVMMSAAIIAAGTLGGIAIADLSGVGIKLAQPTYAGTYALTSDESTALAKYQSSGASSLTAPEMALVGMAQFKQHDTSLAIAEGSATASIITQQVRSAFVHNYQEYFLEANSYSSMATPAHRGYKYNVDLSASYGVDGTADSGAETATWTYPGTTYTPSTYAAKYGKDVNDPFIYDINSSTTTGTITSASGVYTDTLTVSESGWSKYKLQIAAYSGKTFKGFKSCSVTLTLDSSLQLKKMYVNEVYTVSTGLLWPSTSDVTNKITTYYVSGDSAYTIPRNTSVCSGAVSDFPFSTYWAKVSA
jgi:hypothetical protein